jgi:2,3-bisphosphoglycerate-independent phosphoglycerate mutase
MDGWGKELDPKRSAIAQASTPFVDSLYKTYPNCLLQTFGEAVGLPEGQMGNSEVGHMNLGAGRIVYQELQRINKAVAENELAQNKVLIDTFEHAKKNKKALHFMGLVSDGGVHSHIEHLIALCNYAADYGVPKVHIHCFLDGRDCAPDSGLNFIKLLEDSIADGPCKIASVIGRYYAMDRDKRWERVEKAYNLLVNGIGEPLEHAFDGVQASYKKGISDEFIEPIVITDEEGSPIGKIKDGDAVLCFNFRTDRCREITEVLTQSDLHEYNMHKLNLYYTTMTRYDDKFKNVHILFEKDNLSNTLGEVIARADKTQLRIAETEKYPHVSFFFSGGRETPFKGESRIMVNSPKVATYDLQPEMSAFELKEKAIEFINKEQADFICLNFANTDMVGHTGVFEAAVKAAETVDECVKDVVTSLLAHDYAILLTADHGNADIMVNEDGTPHTSHTKNLVPLFLISSELGLQIKDGKLGDLAPTILALMGLDKPKQMTGHVLL